jgi:hypothetical protein
MPSSSLNSFLNSLYLQGILGVARFSNTLILGNNFLLAVEVTTLSIYISFKAIYQIVFLSTIKRC